MPSSTPNRGLSKPNSGEFNGTWGTAHLNPNFDNIDEAFASTTGAGGHSHDGTAGEGPQLDHNAALTNVGTRTHAVIDTDLDAHETRITDLETTVDTPVTGLVDRVVALEGGLPNITHLPNTHAPVAFVDTFAYHDDGCYDFLDNGAWLVVTNDQNISLVGTGDSLLLTGDPSETGRDTAEEADVLLVPPVTPHTLAQRTTISVTHVSLATLAIGDAAHIILQVMGPNLLGTNQFLDHGVLCVMSVTKTGADAYDVFKNIYIAADGTTLKTYYTDAQIGLTAAAALPLLLGKHELTTTEDKRVVYYHDDVVILYTAADALDTFDATLSAALVAAGMPDFGFMGFSLGYSLDPLEDGVANIEISHTSFGSAGNLTVEAAEPGTSLNNSTLPALCPEVVGELCVTSGFWDGTSVGDEITFLGATYKVVACSNDPYGFVINDFQMGPAGAHATLVPGNAMSSSGLVNLYRTALNPVEPGLLLEPPTIYEGTEGQVIDVLMATNVPPDVEVTASAGITIRNTEYIDVHTVRVYFDTDPDTEGDPFTVTFTSTTDPANTYTEQIATIADAPVEFVSIAYEVGGTPVTTPYEGETFDYTLRCTNIEAGATVTFTGADVTAFTAVVTAPDTVTGTLTLAEPKTGPAVSVTLDNGGGNTQTTELFTPADAQPVGAYCTIANPNTGTLGTTGTVVGFHFDSDATLTITPGMTANLSYTWVSATLINITAVDVTGPPTTDLTVTVTNVAAGTSVIIPLFQIQASGAVTVNPVAGSIQEGQSGVAVVITGAGFDPACRVTSNVPNSPITIVSFAPGGPGLKNTINITIDVDAGTSPLVPTWTVTNPSGQTANNTQAAIVNEPTPTGPFVYTPSGTFQPGDSGTLTIDAASGFAPGIEVTTTNPETDIVLSNTTYVSGIQLTVDYQVPYTAVPGTSIALDFTNPGLTAAADSTDIVYPPPQIYGIRFDAKYENQTGVSGVIRGRDFQAAATLDFTLNDPGIVNVVVGAITSETIAFTCDIQSVTGGNNITYSVTNPDLQDDTGTFQISNTPTPVIANVVLTPNEEGAVGADLYIIGKFLYPTATYAFTGAVFSNIVEVSRTSTEWHFTVDITGTAGDTFGIDITYDTVLYSYPDFGTVEAPPVGPATITGVSTGTLTENTTGITFTVTGTGLQAAQVDEVVFNDDSLLLPLPFFGQVMVENVTILTQSSTSITGTFDLNGSVSTVALNERWGLEEREIASVEVKLLTVTQDTFATALDILPDPLAPGLTPGTEAAFIATPNYSISPSGVVVFTFTVTNPPGTLTHLWVGAVPPNIPPPGITVLSFLSMGGGTYQLTYSIAAGVLVGTQAQFAFWDGGAPFPGGIQVLPAATPYSALRFQTT